MADFTSRFNELLAKTPTSDSALAGALGVSKQTISAWKNGTRFPKRPAVRTIADYFGVCVPWLEGITDEPGDAYEVSAPDAQEIALTAIYRGLNEQGKAHLLKYAQYLDADPEMKKDSGSSGMTA